MCSRFYYDANAVMVMKQMAHSNENYNYEYSKDVFPNQEVLALYQKNHEVCLGTMHWGMTRNNKNITHARKETLREKKLLQNLVDQQRCVIAVKGFYEYRGSHRFRFETEEPLYLAGLYEEHNNQKDMVILTREAKGKERLVHSRMPLRLHKSEVNAWLNNEVSLELCEDQEEIEPRSNVEQFSLFDE